MRDNLTNPDTAPTANQTADGAAVVTPKRKEGRPPIDWTHELKDKIVDAIGRGNSEKVAAECANVGYRTFCEYKKNDAEFSQRCQRARAQSLRDMLEEYRTTNDPVRAKIIHHWLSVKDRDEWAQTTKIEHSGAVDILTALQAQDPGEVPIDGDTP